MKKLAMFCRIAGLGFALLMHCGCGIETDPSRALHAKHKAVVRRLLVSLEVYNTEKGALPTSLEELRGSDGAIRDITTLDYAYSPTGIVVADGSVWLVSVRDPLRTSEVLVGRLPVEVASRMPRQE